ncbi:hypothetical protein KUTeg_022570 [Tegillarca granosa]|uniref:Alpha-N-acetylglucosaminidase n=1 Tax=Tegillarca granosa TaxID=220873 RepID=A0ABQ9E9G0_TEGGR|nr:hypothetical protein KUTeg_022570 [Tegillarca granosa]
MKLHITTYLLLVVVVNIISSKSVFDHLNKLLPKSSNDIQTTAVKALIGRVVPSRQNEFNVIVDGKYGPDMKDMFYISSNSSGGVNIRASTGVAAAKAFYLYLTDYCNCQITWAGSQVNLPKKLPTLPNDGIQVTSNDRFRFYINTCTFSYSYIFFNWTDWERHIDWMAMHGINLPLAFTGKEAIFQRVFQRFGFTAEEMRAEFGGPAFLAWARMGNIRAWGGPLPQSFIDNQLQLQHQILKRMRSLGMLPVLPGFAGHVPNTIKKHYPSAIVTEFGIWNKFNKTYSGTYLLDFEDPLFLKIGSAVIQEMINEFGTDHVYSIDSFNENDPTESSYEYIEEAGRRTFEAMDLGDPKGIWIMMGWLFYMSKNFWTQQRIETYLTAVPQGRIIILDYFAEVYPVYSKTNSFFGQPFMWSVVHNFGGVFDLYGKLDSYNNNPFNARDYPNSTMVGISVVPEGIFQNEVAYELMFENSWISQPLNLTDWISKFAIGRYGKSNIHADKAWQLLKMSVYNNTNTLEDHSLDTIVSSRPRLSPPLKPAIWYDPLDLYTAWENILLASDDLELTTLFRYDLVDITRNALQIVSIDLYNDVVEAYQKKDLSLVMSTGKALLEILSDMDLVLFTDEHFLLGAWLRAANITAGSESEKPLFMFNSINQITLWGPSGQLTDYAARQYSGLISG